jgi:DNA mismatch endonuclease (patch repair protein)
MKNRRASPLDLLPPQQRSALMARIRGRNTKPELSVRRALSELGYRYRLHAPDLPGRPDIVFRSRRSVIFVHGCFWHRHTCGLAYSPKTRHIFWEEKFRRNVLRDKVVRQSLKKKGWRILVIWECEINEPTELRARLKRFLGPPSSSRRRKAN